MGVTILKAVFVLIIGFVLLVKGADFFATERHLKQMS